MSRKAFHIGIDLDIHAVSCPGVWLCPKGDAMLRISMLGASAHTKRVEPSFPLLFHESFHFRKTFTGVTSLAGLQTELTSRLVDIQLVQWQVHGCRCVLLAVFRSPLSELLYPKPANRGLVAGVDVDLLMEPTSCFPGIIAPKVEVSTKVVIEEMVNYRIHEHDSIIISHKTLSSKKSGNKKEDSGEGKTKSVLSSSLHSRMRQKPVCHSRPSVRCYYCHQRVDRARRVRGRGKGEAKCDCGGASGKNDTLYIPYCNKCGDVVEETEAKQGKVILKESSQGARKWEAACPCAEPQRSKSACDCSLCRRYHSLFKDPAVSLAGSDVSPNFKFPKWRTDHSLSPSKKDKCCSCLVEKPGVDAQSGNRLRAGANHLRCGCPCERYHTLTDSVDDYGVGESDQIWRGLTKDDNYRDMFKTDLDTHYKKLYERVSRRNNRRES